jgi:serine/threonine protein kinase
MIDKSYDSKTDIWSCGIMAHLLLSKQLPFGLMDLEDEDDIMDTIA